MLQKWELLFQVLDSVCVLVRLFPFSISLIEVPKTLAFVLVRAESVILGLIEFPYLP